MIIQIIKILLSHKKVVKGLVGLDLVRIESEMKYRIFALKLPRRCEEI